MKGFVWFWLLPRPVRAGRGFVFAVFTPKKLKKYFGNESRLAERDSFF